MTEGRRYHFDRDTLSLTLLPCGRVEREELGNLAEGLAHEDLLTTLAKERPIPAAAFNSQRRQYRADAFLTIAHGQPGDRVLVVTNCDLYADNLNFVLGLADSPGKGAVISLLRLRWGADEQIFLRRMLKEAVHELGHTFGLPHCSNPSCVMAFSNSLADTDRKEPNRCERCESKLQAYRRQAPLFQNCGG